jgi:hypothetical protein
VAEALSAGSSRPPPEAPAQSASAEQRRSRRQLFTKFVWYCRVREAGESSGPLEEGLAHACDISASGVGVVTSQPIAANARLFLEIAAKAGTLSLVARVTHCRKESDGKFRLGLDLEVVPPNDRATLARILGE